MNFESRPEISFLSYSNAIKSFNLAFVDICFPQFQLVAKYKDIVIEGLKYGYIFDGSVVTESFIDWLEDQAYNPNSTFFKTWEDVTTKSREEIALYQVLHYMTTYGGLGIPGTNGFVPNEDPVELDFEAYKVILPGTSKQIAERCYELLKSGMALSSETLLMCEEFINYELYNVHIGKSDFTLDVNEIKNREALVYFCYHYDMMPVNPIDMLRVIVYGFVSHTLLIKSKNVIEQIKNSSSPYDLSKLSETELKNLSKIFYRFKPLFLAMKSTSEENSYAVNRIRRLAKENHKPFKAGFFEDLFNQHWMENVTDAVGIIQKTNNPFKLIRAYGAINQYIASHSDDSKPYTMLYIIRNGKVFRKDYDNADKTPESKIKCLEYFRCLIYERLVSALKEQIKKTGKDKVLVPEFYNLVCPVSEKMFLGNMPFGTNFPMADNNYFGVYWRDEWGTRDFDLSFIDWHGIKYGWDSRFYDEKKDTIIFSGDMTEAEPEATEMFYCSKNVPDGVLRINRYSGEVNSKYRLFFGNDNLGSKNFGLNFMVDPKTIKMSADLISVDKQHVLGVVLDNIFYVIVLPESNLRSSGHNETEQKFAEGLKLRIKNSYMDLKNLLEDAGYTVVNKLEDLGKDENDNTVVPDYDFSNPEKDALISFFTSAFEENE